jgi:hypothetical protein
MMTRNPSIALGMIDSRLGGREPMRKQHPNKKRRALPKTVLRLPDLDQAKSAVLK